MNTLVVSGLVLLVLLLLVVFWTRGKKGKPLPYDVQETLFSPAERASLGGHDAPALAGSSAFTAGAWPM